MMLSHLIARRLLGLAREHVDYLVLEVPQLSLPKDLDAVEDLTRPEMEDAGFRLDTRHDFLPRQHFLVFEPQAPAR